MAMELSELQTVSGKPISVAAGIRIPIETYLRAKKRAQREDVKLNRLLCDLITRGLDMDREQPKGVGR
jgi:hypothetical protein